MLSDSSHRIDRWRLFYAWKPGEALRKTIIDTFSEAGDLKGVRWVRSENLHVTLYFIGNTHPEDVPALIESTGMVLNARQKITLRSEGFIYRGKPGRASMIWLSFLKSVKFTSIHGALKDIASVFVDPQVDFRQPIPHITVARMGRAFRNDHFSLPDSASGIAVDIDRVELWRSEKTSDGVRYASLAGWPLEDVSGSLPSSP